ncbi:MAG TPA: rhodanese-like domain-containing protein [Thermoanaerobaculia bacterium]|nr:rhodanese-like domain-containing protein [Thermoanaerobaculia bacterium]
MLKNPFAQGVLIVATALVLAIVTNGFASRTRRLVLPGFYPNALRVPPKASEITPPVSTLTAAPTTTAAFATDTTATTATVAQSPAPGQPPIAIDTTTIGRPAGATTTTAPPAAATATQAPQQPAEDPLARFQPHPDKAFVEISGADAALLHAKGALFLDARRTSVYEEGHIAGARPFSVWEGDIDDKVNNLFAERSDPRDQNLPIVIYCSGGACEDSHMLAQKLWGIQFNNLYVYKDGFPDWQKRGGAVRTGAQQ